MKKNLQDYLPKEIMLIQGNGPGVPRVRAIVAPLKYPRWMWGWTLSYHDGTKEDDVADWKLGEKRDHGWRFSKQGAYTGANIAITRVWKQMMKDPATKKRIKELNK